MEELQIAELDERSAAALGEAFSRGGWEKGPSQYTRYLEQHRNDEILCLVAQVRGVVAGYLKVVWSPQYGPLRDAGIPEIQDLNVLEEFRRRGVASRLLDLAEREISKRSRYAGIGVGLSPGYEAAQRLYVLRGYVPDGKGVTYKDEPVQYGMPVVFDDDLVLHFIKEVRDD